ncbi:unnamed protein product [Rotaria socialis]|uniref:Uncharacterized protein n=1 Tax=Rotaria socialis TaxID=392032 RepID=A0A817LIF8_9BILA|nr:unnamed protein product [Rotaria socialis]CAF3425301.1 unnamed protein product [Rotaria socialis]CAF4309527.1 unnamed protein product [Rotaria socialis]CAF4549509.1 unnamed protein product [Rotaria socialis]
MAVFGTDEYEFKMFGTTVTVPNADIAKIVHYLDCICTVIDYNDNDINRYRKYSNWANMSNYEDRLIYLLALALSPDELEDKVFFESTELCPTTNNQFYEIGQIKNLLVVAPSIIIGGRSRQVKKIMTYEPIWLQRNYYEPMLRLQRRFSPGDDDDDDDDDDDNNNYTTSSSTCVIS